MVKREGLVDKLVVSADGSESGWARGQRAVARDR